MSAGGRIAFVVVGATLLGLFASSLPATAHPSAFETLTLDFLVAPRGLEVIDAAVVESRGPSYQPFPTSEFKHDVAVDVLDALHLPLSTVEIDAELSERYHEVGFLIRFDEPSLGVATPLSIETAGLQEIVADRGLRHLKLSVCGVADGAASPASPSMLSQLDIQASQRGGPTALARAACEGWTLAPTDQPVSILVKPQQVSLPTTTTATSSDTKSGADSSPDHAAARQSDDEDDDSFPLGIVIIAAVLVGLAAAGVIWYLRLRGTRAAT